MNIITPSVEILSSLDAKQAVDIISLAARTCYKSTPKSPDANHDLIRSIIKKKHHSVLEHYSITVRFIVDRGVSHELVRHRLMAISQESTRYCNYGNAKGGINIIHPPKLTPDQRWRRERLYETIELLYNKELEEGLTPQIARGLLPNALKTELVVTANIREWRHILTLRAAPDAHPQMQEVMVDLKDKLKHYFTIFFEDIT